MVGFQGQKSVPSFEKNTVGKPQGLNEDNLAVSVLEMATVAPAMSEPTQRSVMVRSQ
jgi:hypothetical protein